MSEELPEETALYHIFGDADLLLYIGISNDFGRRWKQHARQQPWWDEKRRMTTLWFGSREEAEAAEIAAIHAEHPKYNVQHNEAGPVQPGDVQRSPWLTMPEAAVKAGCERRAIYAAASSGHLKVQRPEGCRPVVHEDELAKWMAARQPGKVPAGDLSDRQVGVLLDIYLGRPDDLKYGMLIPTLEALRRRGLIADGSHRGLNALTAEGERIARELHDLSEVAPPVVVASAA